MRKRFSSKVPLQLLLPICKVNEWIRLRCRRISANGAVVLFFSFPYTPSPHLSHFMKWIGKNIRRYSEHAEFELGLRKFLPGNERCPFPCRSVTYLTVGRFSRIEEPGKEVGIHWHRQPVTWRYSNTNLCNRDKTPQKISVQVIC